MIHIYCNDRWILIRGGGPPVLGRVEGILFRDVPISWWDLSLVHQETGTSTAFLVVGPGGTTTEFLVANGVQGRVRVRRPPREREEAPFLPLSRRSP